MNEKIIIGIVSKHIPPNNKKHNTYIRDEVKQAIFDNGGIAIGILPTEEVANYTDDNWHDNMNDIEKNNLIKQLELCDGLILQGGLETDNYECWVARYAYDNDIPILAICAGQNNLIRALGGTTYKIPNPEKHDISFDNYVHSLKIDKNSKFFQIIRKQQIMVNSRHRRAVKECPNLNKVAHCEDGYPDVIESPDRRFYVGVRFHPESLYKSDENMNNIFIEFLKSCTKYKGREKGN